MRFEQALQAMRIGKVVYNKQEPDIKCGMDDLIDGKSLWYERRGQKYYFCDVFGFQQKEILSEDWEIAENEQKS